MNNLKKIMSLESELERNAEVLAMLALHERDIDLVKGAAVRFLRTLEDRNLAVSVWCSDEE